MNLPCPQQHLTVLALTYDRTQCTAIPGHPPEPLVCKVLIGARPHTATWLTFSLQPFSEVLANTFSLCFLWKLEWICMA